MPKNIGMLGSNAAPGFRDYPDHTLTMEPVIGSVRIEAFGQTIAETVAAIWLRESRYAPVIYVPRGDVRFGLLRDSETTTYCPFKGTASYWSLQIGDDFAGDAVWGYDNPYDEVADLADRVAFYPDRVGAILLDGQPLQTS